MKSNLKNIVTLCKTIFLTHFKEYANMKLLNDFKGNDEARSLIGHLERVEFMVQPTQSVCTDWVFYFKFFKMEEL